MADTLDYGHLRSAFFLGNIDEMSIADERPPDEDVIDVSPAALAAFSSRAVKGAESLETTDSIAVLTGGGLSGLESLLYVGETLANPLLGSFRSKFAGTGKVTPRYWAGKAAVAGAQALRRYAPTVKVTAATVRQTKTTLAKKLAARRQAIVSASAGFRAAAARVAGLNVRIAVFARQTAAARAAGRTGRVKILATKIAQLNAAKILTTNVGLRFAKTQALATVLAKNTATQESLVSMAGTLAARGDPGANVLVAAAKGVEEQNKELLTSRAEQIQKWSATPPADEAPPSASTVPPEGEGFAPPIDEDTGVPEGEAMEPATEASPTAEAEAEATTEESPTAEQAAELEDLGIKIPGYSKIKKVAQKLKKSLEPIAAAAKALIKKGACALAKNPAVMQAIASATSKATAVFGGPAAGAAAAKAVKSKPVVAFLSKACPPGQKAQEVVLPSGVIAVVKTPPPPVETKPMSPAVLAIPAAALFLL